MGQRLLTVLVAGAGIVGLAASDGASRSGGWDAPQTFAPGANDIGYESMRLLPMSHGDALAFWWAFPKWWAYPKDVSAAAPVRAREAVFRASERWSKAKAVPVPAIATRDLQRELRPTLTADARGGVVATWVAREARGFGLYEARRTSRRPWTKPRKLFHLARRPYALSRGFGDDGSSAILWGAGDHWKGPRLIDPPASPPCPKCFDGVVVAVKRGRGRWSRLRRLTVGISHGGSIAFDGNGNPVALWTDCAPPNRDWGCALRTAFTVAASTRWVRRTLAHISPSYGDRPGPHLGKDAGGGLFAVWIGARGRAIESASWSRRTLSWSQPVTVDRIVEQSTPEDLDLAARPSGDAVVTWIVPARSVRDSQIRVATRDASGNWSAPQTLAVGARNPRVAVSRGGHVAAVWETPRPEPGSEWVRSSRVHAVLRRPGAGWEGPFDVSSGAEHDFDPEVVAFDDAVLVGWTTYHGPHPYGTYIVQTAAYMP